MTRTPQICLASASPRRRELLTQLGVEHRVAPADIDESRRDGESPTDYVLRMAGEKAQRIAAAPERSHGLPVLGADTAVVIEGRVLGQPADAAEAQTMLELLSDRVHEVLSAVVLITASGSGSRLSRTEVRFRPISADEAAAYWRSGEPRGKAGGYAIQGRAAVFVASLSGSYSGVVGLPLFETAQLLETAGIAPWRDAAADRPASAGVPVRQRGLL
ncbi:MAG: nucleoside triphosphate pyrophosphatase [Steroidobacteraceae bacterium]|nr:septum formation inhibitor Maf [Nevskiaceae bacterium]